MRPSNRRSRIAGSVLAGCSVLAALALRAQDACPPPDGPTDRYIPTADLAFRVESAAGAVGDVVAVTVSMRSRIINPGWTDMTMAVCHDPAVAELVGTPSFSEEFISISGGIGFYPVKEGAGLPGDHRGHGFMLTIDLTPWGYDGRFPSEEPLALMTVYYRVKGMPGDTGEVTICDGALARHQIRCMLNELYAYDRDYPATPYRHWLSTDKTAGRITVLGGPATHPDRPPEPPEVKVYPELPTAEEVNFRVRINGATARPGSSEVPIEVYIQADVEYSLVVLPIDFDERYLRLARVEDYFLTGIVNINPNDRNPGAGPEEGNVSIFSGMGVAMKRIAPEGEEVHAATLYFDVLEAASEITTTALELTTITTTWGVQHVPQIGVWHQGQLGLRDPVRSSIEPLLITNGIVAVLPDITLFNRGDVNDDHLIDMSDPVSLLAFLFLGGRRPPCRDAADVNDDGALDISDPVRLLEQLFIAPGELPAPSGYLGADPTDDALDCRGGR